MVDRAMKKPAADDQFSPEETKKRFEAALRGARIAGAKHKSAPKKKASQKRKRNPA
jgi:hypothetical protein